MFSKKLVALGLAASVVMASFSASAGVIGETTLTGTNSESGKYNLGSGSHTLVAKASKGSGTASVKKVIAYFPDSTIASVSVSAAATNPSTASFTSNAYTDSGVGQSYYISWAGSSTSVATASITH